MRDWLRAARLKRRMTQKQLAENLGISESYYCTIENGKRMNRLDIEIIAKLSVIFGIPMDKIIRLETRRQYSAGGKDNG